MPAWPFVFLQEKTGAPTAIGEHVVDVQRIDSAGPTRSKR
jgi:hypothetical protein